MNYADIVHTRTQQCVHTAGPFVTVEEAMDAAGAIEVYLNHQSYHVETRTELCAENSEPSPTRRSVTDEMVAAAAQAYVGDEMSGEEWAWVKTQPEIVAPYLAAMRAALQAAEAAR